MQNDNFNYDAYKVTEEVEEKAIQKFRMRFGAETKYIKTANLERILLSCSYGELKVHFEKQVLNSKGTEIIVDGFCAGIELYVPKSWNVVQGKVKAFMGKVDFEDGIARNSNDSATAVINGNLRLCGVKVIYV